MPSLSLMYCQYTTVCCYTYANLHNFFSTLWKHLTQELYGVSMEWAQAIHDNRHLWKLPKKFTVDFVKLVTVLSAHLQTRHSMSSTTVVVQSALGLSIVRPVMCCALCTVSEFRLCFIQLSLPASYIRTFTTALPCSPNTCSSVLLLPDPTLFAVEQV